ncbi:MAG: ABC transporter ATP-binding protein [Alphaproteobacteria bacterium]|nr:ABC transporter ATP-binding protein [Alphaproteobacteria bacterium]
MSAPLRIHGLRHAFGSLEVLRGVELTLDGPGVYGFLGVNGSGKSTTMRALMGFLRPDAGELSILGRPPGHPEALARVGYLPQAPAFHEWMTAGEWMRLSGRLCGLRGQALEARAAKLLAELGLEDAASRRIGGFSGGMKQRLGLAQALLPEPALLLLDEPVSALDPVGRKELLERISALGESVTVFMSTHILADVERVCDRVAILHHGQIQAFEPTRALVSRHVKPVFVLELTDEPSALVARLRAEQAVVEVKAEGKMIHVSTHDPAWAWRALPAAVSACGLGLKGLRQENPDLEQIFMAMIGGDT